MKCDTNQPILLNVYYSSFNRDCFYVNSWFKYYIIQYKDEFLTSFNGNYCTSSVANLAMRFCSRHAALSYLKEFFSPSFIKDCVIRSLVSANVQQKII